MFLCETNLKSDEMVVVANKLKFEKCINVDCNRRRGGISLLRYNKSDILINFIVFLLFY